MMRFQLPAGTTTVSIEGQTFQADEDGFVEVPDAFGERFAKEVTGARAVGPAPMTIDPDAVGGQVNRSPESPNNSYGNEADLSTATTESKVEPVTDHPVAKEPQKEGPIGTEISEEQTQDEKLS